MFSFASQKMASGEAAVQPIMTSNGGIAFPLQSARLVAAVAELGSFGGGNTPPLTGKGSQA